MVISLIQFQMIYSQYQFSLMRIIHQILKHLKFIQVVINYLLSLANNLR